MSTAALLTIPESDALALRSASPAPLDPYIPRSHEQAVAIAATLGKAAGLSMEEAYLKMATGAEYGIPSTTALRQIDIIPGPNNSKQVGLRAQLMVALCLRAKGICEYFRFVEGDAKSATYAAKRVGEPEDRETYTFEQAVQAGLVKDGGAWKKDPASQLIARASARLARRVFPDLLGNVYTAEELREAAEEDRTPPAQVAPLPRTAAPAERIADAEVIDHTARIVAALESAPDEAAIKALAAEAVRVWPKDRPDAVKAAHKAAKARVAAAKEPAHDEATGVVTEREPGAEG